MTVIMDVMPFEDNPKPCFLIFYSFHTNVTDAQVVGQDDDAINYKIVKVYSLEYIAIPKVFFMPHNGW